MRKILLLGFVVLMSAACPDRLTAQEDRYQFLEEKAIVFNILTEVRDAEGTPLWNVESQTYTISGRPVNLSLNGDTLKVIVHLTPYIKEDGTFLLLAQGEVWVTHQDGKMDFHTTMESLPVKHGESVFFFPLGIQEKNDSADESSTDEDDTPSEKVTLYTIEIEIQVFRYKELVKGDS
ncbi:MAG: hypothetical protein KAU17_10285 [Spirochaetales bacterium]|nr:hypothetical protein [Spirochaetales bacterium]